MKAFILSILMLSLAAFTAEAQTSLHRMMRANANEALMAASNYRLQGKTTQYYNSQSFIPATKVEHSYDGTHRVLTQRYFYDDTESDFVLSQQTTRVFDNNRITEEIEQFWDPDEGAFINSDRYLYRYESTSSTISNELIYQYWDGTQWVNDERDLYEINNGLPTTGTYQLWENGEWLNLERYVFQQFSDHVSEFIYTWDGSAWVDSTRMDFPEMSLETLYAYFSDLEQHFEDYELLMLFSFIPDFSSYLWDIQLEEYVSDFRQVTVDNEENGKLASRDIIMQKYSEGQWADSSKTTITYDDSGLEESMVYSSNSFQVWVPQYRESYVYDDNENIIRISEEFNMGDSWELGSETEFVWDLITSIEGEREAISTYHIGSIYPNPFNPEATIPIVLAQSSQVNVVIYDLLGRQLQSVWNGPKMAGSHDIRFNASQLPSGVYLIKVAIDKQTSIQRVTLLK